MPELDNVPMIALTSFEPMKDMFEMEGVTEEVAREALRLASTKLPMKCKFVTRNH